MQARALARTAKDAQPLPERQVLQDQLEPHLEGSTEPGDSDKAEVEHRYPSDGEESQGQRFGSDLILANDRCERDPYARPLGMAANFFIIPASQILGNLSHRFTDQYSHRAT